MIKAVLFGLKFYELANLDIDGKIKDALSDMINKDI
jgi:hypothetical protein